MFGGEHGVHFSLERLATPGSFRRGVCGPNVRDLQVCVVARSEWLLPFRGHAAPYDPLNVLGFLASYVFCTYDV